MRPIRAEARSAGGQTAVVFDVQRFSLHDGPGIRTTVFLKGCPLRCMWCQNPEAMRPDPEIAFYPEHCRGAFDCESVCPRGAILVDSPRRPAPRGGIDFTRCDACGQCAAVCSSRALRVIGKSYDPHALLREILKDRDFFSESGGVTFSGGEPLLQAAFLARLLPLLKEQGVGVNVETCGVFRYDSVEALLPHLDQIFFDLKHMDTERHKLYTGCSNQPILENFGRLAADFSGLVARMPIIPGINDDPDNLRATARFLKQHGQDIIHCLPYCNFWESKLSRIDTAQRPLGTRTATAADLAPVAAAFAEEGIHAVVYD